MGCSNDFNIYGFTTTILNLIMDLKNTQTLIVRASSKPEDILPRLESTILDRKKQYVDKINVLLASWEHVSTYLICASSEVIDKLISFIYRHTLHMILKADWKRVNKAIKTHLMVTVTRCHRELDMKRNLNDLCVALCYNLIHIMNDPWDFKTLTDIIHGKETTDQEVQKYFVSENGVLVVMRIEALVDSKCEDFALRLADTCQQFLKTEKAKESNNNALLEQGKQPMLATYQLDLITDLYLTLLSRCGKNFDLKSVFQDYNLKEGVNLLRRYRDRKCGFGLNSKLWKNYKKIVEIGSCVFLTTAFLQPIEEIENCNLLEALITEWLTFQTGSQLEDVIKKLVYSALSSQHIYTFCQVLIKHSGLKLKSFCIELFIIALTVNMNEIETQRDKGDKEKVRQKEIQLANGFLLLADLLQDDLGVCRECVLTAFSLNPTESNLERIKSLAVACGKCTPGGNDSDQQQQQQEPTSNLDTGQKPSNLSTEQQTPNCTVCLLNGSSPIDKKCSKCSSSSPNGSLPDNSTKKERTLDALIRIEGKAVTESLNYDVLSAPSQVLDAESLGLSDVLCNDLATVISSPRYQMLSWVQDWPELLSVCESYLESGGEMKNQTKELKFLNIDYNIFKDWPEVDDSDMYCGIEKGYEQCIEPTDDYYVPTKIPSKKTDSDSSDSFVPKKKKRQRPRKNSTDVTQETKRKRKPRSTSFKDIYPNVSDADTGTQDSILNTDSLGSDCFQPQQVKKNLKSTKTGKRKIQRKERVINCQELTNDSSIGSDMSNNEEFLSSFINRQKNFSLLRKVSDPFVVKALRMFRRKPNHHLSSSLDTDDPEPYLNINNNFKSCDDLSHELEKRQTTIQQHFDKNKPNLMMRMESNSRFKSKFVENFIHNNDENCINGKNISNDLITRDNLCKTVPGLNSLDMIIPDILQPTVQIVQLPDNWNQANNSQSSEIVSSLLPQQTNSATTSEQNKSNTASSSSSSSSANTTASSADASQMQGGSVNCSLPPQSSSSGGGSRNDSSEQMPNPSVSGAFSQLVSTAKASQTFTRSSRVSQTSMTTPVNVGSTSEPTHMTHTHAVVSRANTAMASALVNTVNTGQYELLSKTASQSNRANIHSQPSVSSNIDLSRAKILASTKDSLSSNTDNSQSSSNQVCVQLQASDIDFTKAKLVAITKDSLPKFSEDRNNLLANKPALRKQITRLDRSIDGRLLGIGETKKEKKPNATDDDKSASSSNELDIPLQARLIACAKDSMTNSSEDGRNTNEVCIHVQASDIEFTKAKTISIPKESLPKFSEDGRSLSLSNKPVLRIQVPRLEHCKEGKSIGLNETAKDKKSNIPEDNKNASSLSTPLQVFTSDRDNQLSKSRLLAYAKDFMPGNFMTEDSRNSSSSPKPHFRLQIPRLDGKIVGLGDIGKDKKPNMSLSNRSIHESNVSIQTPHSSKLTGLSDTANQKSDSTDQVGFSQIASLPKFQQAFGKTMYQTNSSSIATQSNPICDSSEVTEFSVAGQTPSTSATPNVCTVLSKAVQTSNKETDTKSNKSNQKNMHEANFKTDNLNLKLNQSMRTVQTVVSGNMQPTRIVTSDSKAQERSGLMQTSTSVIFPCKTSTGSVTTGSIIHRKPVAILKTCTATEKSSQTKTDNESNSKESVIHSNINALLTAALQNSSSISPETTAITTVSSGCISKQLTVVDADKKKPEMSVQTILPVANVHRVALPTSMQKNVRRQPVLTPTKFSRSVLQLTNISAQAPASTPSAASTHRSVQSVLTSTPTTRNESLISHNTISETSVSSKTLEQLREFESVLEQVTNTSQMKERSTAQPLSTNLEPLSQPLLQIASQSSTSSTTNFTNTSNSRSPTTYQSQAQTSKTTSVHDLHGERVSLTFIGQTSDEKITSRTPIVLVQNCSSLIASPAASSSSASPASSVNSTTAKLTIKTNKTAKTKSTTKTNPTTTTLKVSTLQKPQQKPQEDEQTTQRIYAILDKYAEQLRNSPELKNKPAPRRRSNPPTNPSPTSKRKKSTQTKSKLSSQQASCSSSGMEMSPGSEDLRTMGSEDSSNGVSQISQVLNSPQSRLDEPSTPTGGDMSSETSESLDSKEPRIQHRVVLADSSVQNRAVIVQDNIQPTVINVEGAKVLTRKQVVVGGTTTMPLISLSNMPGSTVRQVLFPVQEGRLVVTKVPPSFKYKLLPGSPVLAFQQMCVNKQTTNVKHVKNPIVSGITAQSLTGMSTAQPAVVLPQDGKFTISSEAGLEGNISLDNTILINTTSASSISFLHRSVQSNLLSSAAQDTAVTATVTQPPRLVTAATATSCSIQENNRPSSAYQTSANNLLSICTSNVNLIRQETNEKRTVDKILETDFKPNLGTDELDTVQTTNDKNWGLLSVEKSLQSPQSDKVLDFKVTQDSPVESYEFQTPTNLQNQEEQFSVKTESKEQTLPRKVVDELKGFILKKESPKNETDDDDNESSDSTGSGRAKQDNQTKDRKTSLSSDSRAASESSWRYSVLSKPGSPKATTTDTHTTTTDAEIDPDADSNRRDNHASPSQIRRYQRTGSDVQNTIYQMAFRRSDRLRASRKPREPVDTRTVSSLDGELRLQKSLSEECEDLGVDEPSTSDLFPEAELLLDPDPSSRDSCAQSAPAAVFSRSFDDSCCSSSSSPPSSRSSPKRQRLSPSSATSDDSKQGAAGVGSAWHEQDEDAVAQQSRSPVALATAPAFTYSRSRLKAKTQLAKEDGDGGGSDEDDEDDDDDDDDDKCATTSTTDEEMLSEGDFRHVRVLTPNGLAAVQKSHVDNKSLTRNSCSSSSSSSGSSSCSSSGSSSSGGGNSRLHQQQEQQQQQQRRSSLRGHVKKGCRCCNGDSSPLSQPTAAKRRTPHHHHHPPHQHDAQPAAATAAADNKSTLPSRINVIKKR